MLTDLQKIGIGLTGFGIFFLFLGVILFFDHGLLAIGNILFVAGLSCIIGLSNTFAFFFQPTPQKIKGSVCFFSGILMILWISSILGMLVETIGLYYLFSGFIPVVIGFLRRLPGLNLIFSVPVLGKFLDRLGGSQLPM
ncbi:vesicle transporter GOT1B [Salpingoeca rosetta]|uniref:Vesicle transporter GOT1B n=1 Tax=Salpingoeca rosetta (strain ATCC 50818 / BSB-021) TaxID=946362 RepID=F2USM3_SALR5|nr:vesicle transporter GOT1B [Salpingoeca rosetta]EGD81132.1 vesicle transporter GOT1B [Salpingoeca rosetta]|eukprot:XP_004987817.1 vesicle transporter GOT1B [Salpingoeca rosetta]